MNRTHVNEVMTSNQVTVDGASRVEEAAALAEARHIRHLVVLADDGHPAGIVCARNLTTANRDRAVEDVMSTPVETIWSRASVDQAAICMRREHVGCLAVVSDGKVTGIVTRRDLRRAGVLQEATGNGGCDSCGAHSGPDVSAEVREVCFCPACLDRVPPSGLEDEIGSGD